RSPGTLGKIGKDGCQSQTDPDKKNGIIQIKKPRLLSQIAYLDLQVQLYTQLSLMSNGVTPIIGRRTALRTILIFYGYDDEGEDEIEIAGQRENMNLKNKSSEKMEMFEMRL